MLINSGVLTMALYFDDDHLNSSDRRKNADNTKYNGGVEKGIAKKWEKTQATKHDYNAAGGASMSRKQGTGELGRAATVPGEVTDTSVMSPEEKFRYLQALGMLPGKEPEVKAAPAQTPKMNQNRPFRRGR